MKKGVVYTCLFGWKEDLYFDRYEGSEVDFIVFSDQKIEVPKGCQLIVVEDTGVGPERLSRRPKVLPHRFLNEYDWSLYIDNKVRLKKRPEDIYMEYLERSEAPYICFSSSARKCAYHEGEVIIAGGYELEDRVREQLDCYKTKGFPAQFGVSSGTVLLRRHNDKAVIKHHEDWYEHILRFSKRDQLSFDYLRWLHKLPITNFKGSILEGNDIAEWRQIKRLLPDFRPQDFAWFAGLDPSSSEGVLREKALAITKSGRLPKRYRWRLERIFNRLKSDRGNLYYNAHGYVYIYESLLRYLRDEEFTLFEVGQLSNGYSNSIKYNRTTHIPSIYAWAEYFPKAFVAGYDPASIEIKGSDQRLSVYKGEFGSGEDIKSALKEMKTRPKVAINTGSQASHHQQIFLECVIDHISPGGHLFIENLHQQPADLEKPDAPKTISILRDLAMGKSRVSPYLSEKAQQCILEKIEKIEFFDSREIFTGHIYADALCHIKLKD